MNEKVDSRLLTVKDVAKLVQAGERTVWRWSRSGVMPPPLKIGPKSVRYRKAEIEEWLEAGCPRVAA